MNPSAHAFSLILQQRNSERSSASSQQKPPPPPPPPPPPHPPSLQLPPPPLPLSSSTSSAYSAATSSSRYHPSRSSSAVAPRVRTPLHGRRGTSTWEASPSAHAYPRQFSQPPATALSNSQAGSDVCHLSMTSSSYTAATAATTSYHTPSAQSAYASHESFPARTHLDTSSTLDPAAPPSPAPSMVPLACEPCNKSFLTQESYQAHLQTHTNCSYPDCTFRASPKVVQSHFLSVHGQYSGSGYKTIDVEGQQFQVLMGTSPEEVAAWRAERRLRFPSSARIEEKTQMAEKIQDSGGVPRPSSRKRPIDKSELISDPLDCKPQRKICKYFRQGKCTRGDECTYRHDLSQDRPAKSAKESTAVGLQHNLLKKLLEKDIARDENLLLQCLHFVRTENFFATSEPAVNHAIECTATRDGSASEVESEKSCGRRQGDDMCTAVSTLDQDSAEGAGAGILNSSNNTHATSDVDEERVHDSAEKSCL